LLALLVISYYLIHSRLQIYTRTTFASAFSEVKETQPLIFQSARGPASHTGFAQLHGSELRGAFEEVARHFPQEHGNGIVGAEVHFQHLRLGSLQLLSEGSAHQLEWGVEVHFPTFASRFVARRPLKLQEVSLSFRVN